MRRERTLETILARAANAGWADPLRALVGERQAARAGEAFGQSCRNSESDDELARAIAPRTAALDPLGESQPSGFASIDLLDRYMLGRQPAAVFEGMMQPPERTASLALEEISLARADSRAGRRAAAW